MEQPLEACVLPLSGGLSNPNPAMRAAYLKAALQCMQLDLNRLCRRDPRSHLNAASAAILNIVCQEIRNLLSDTDIAGSLMPACDSMSHADAMLLLAQYKLALRTYSVDCLGQNPYEV